MLTPIIHEFFGLNAPLLTQDPQHFHTVILLSPKKMYHKPSSIEIKLSNKPRRRGIFKNRFYQVMSS
jgi:hypothetical protein